MFIIILKATISIEKMAANDSLSYLGYLNKLVDECDNTYHCSIDKKPIYDAYLALTDEIETNPKAPLFKVWENVRITKYKNF